MRAPGRKFDKPALEFRDVLKSLNRRRRQEENISWVRKREALLTFLPIT